MILIYYERLHFFNWMASNKIGFSSRPQRNKKSEAINNRINKKIQIILLVNKVYRSNPGGRTLRFLRLQNSSMLLHKSGRQRCKSLPKPRGGM